MRCRKINLWARQNCTESGMGERRSEARRHLGRQQLEQSPQGWTAGLCQPQRLRCLACKRGVNTHVMQIRATVKIQGV